MSRHHQDTVTVGVGALSIEEVVAVARFGAQVEISAAALAEICYAGANRRAGERPDSGLWHLHWFWGTGQAAYS